MRTSLLQKNVHISRPCVGEAKSTCVLGLAYEKERRSHHESAKVQSASFPIKTIVRLRKGLRHLPL